MKIKAGPWAPQGDLVMREEDHQGFHDHYISEVTPDLKLKVIARIPKEKLMYEPTVDLRGNYKPYFHSEPLTKPSSGSTCRWSGRRCSRDENVLIIVGPIQNKLNKNTLRGTES